MSARAGNARRLLRQTLTIARRDFVATVFTPTFLLFLLSPMVMVSLGGLIGGMGAASVSSGSIAHEQIVAIVPLAEQAGVQATDARLRTIFPRDERPPTLVLHVPRADPAAQARATFDTQGAEASAALYGSLDHPTILYGGQGRGDADYLAQLAEMTLRNKDARATPLSTAQLTPVTRARVSHSGHTQAAFFAVFGIFFLTLLLAGQAVGTMAEERNNKVVEVLAAAVPLEAVFFGKLVGMFGSALLFVSFWGTVVGVLPLLLPGGLAHAVGDVGPAVGLAAFVPLFLGYFAMSYMLLGAVFLGIGAQATTPRELQMLSLPITVVQMLMFGFAARAASAPGTWVAKAAELFPLSSPYAMAAHAANAPELWPHLAALAWQALWVGIVITLGARAFRRGVLQSGSGKLNLAGMFSRKS